MNNRPAEDIDYTKYGWVPPKQQLPSANQSASADDIDYTKYGYVPPESEESKLKSITWAGPRVLKDLGVSLFDAMKGIPGKFESAKSEIPGLFDVLTQHPGHAAAQLAAGVPEMGQRIFNTPHDLANYASKRLHLLPEDINKKIQMGRMPADTEDAINDVFGKKKYAGDELLRGITRNLDIGLGAGKAALKFNPLKLREGSIVKDVLRSEERNVEKYSGAEGKYKQLQDKAAGRGINGQYIDPAKKDLAVLQEHMPSDEFEAITKLMNDKNLTNAQSAISQLGFRERKLMAKSKRGDILTQPEKDLLQAAKNTKQHIQENMFKDQAGKIHTDLVNEHKAVQKGYREEVIPYTKNKAIQAYKSGDLLRDQLVKSLMSGKFPANAKRIGAQKPLLLRRWIEKHPKTSIGAGLAGAYVGGVPLADKLLQHLSGGTGGQNGQ